LTAGRAFAIAAAIGVAGTAIALVLAARKNEQETAPRVKGSMYPPGVSDSKGPWIYVDPWLVPNIAKSSGGWV